MRAIGVSAPERPPQTVRLRRRRGWRWAVGTVLVGAVLMFCYLRIAGATEVNADAAGLVLQASDMLHGNLLLQGWWDTDVSFITTELPEYMGVTAVAGIRPEVVHICAALTYTLLVLLAAFVARGRARGAEGAVRALLAGGVMLAPQPTWLTPILLGSPDHVGTAVPLLLLLLLLDRLPPTRARLRWYIPVGLCVCVFTAALLAWTMVGDPLVEVVGVVPLALACLLRAIRIIVVRLIRAWRSSTGADEPAAVAVGPDTGRPDTGGPDTGGDDTGGHDTAGQAGAAQDAAAQDRAGPDMAADTSWRSACYYVLLAAAAAAAVPIAGWVNSWITAHHGYQLGPSRYSLLPWDQIAKNVPMAWQSSLALFGADYVGVNGAGNIAFALAHFVGVALVIAAILFAAWRLLVPGRTARAGDLVADFLVLAILVNIAAYFAFIRPGNIYDAHEIGPVASFGAALTGRMLGGPLLRLRRGSRQRDRESGPDQESPPDRKPRLRLPWVRPVRSRRGIPVLVPVLAAGLALYLALLGIAAATPQGPPQHVDLATWLDQHNLRSGLASYWESASVTVDSDDKITMLAVGIHGWRRQLGPDQWETDVRLADPATHTANFIVVGPDRIVPAKLALQMFGKPAQTYHFELYTIMVWNKNLIAEL